MLSFMLYKKCPEKLSIIWALINQILKRRNTGMEDRVEVEISSLNFLQQFIIFSKLNNFLNHLNTILMQLKNSHEKELCIN